MEMKSESEVAQSCLTLSDPMDCGPPGPPSMGFSRQEYWSGVPLPSPTYLCMYLYFKCNPSPASEQVGAKEYNLVKVVHINVCVNIS